MLTKQTISTVILAMMLTSVLALPNHVWAASKTVYVDGENVVGPWDGTAEHPYQNMTNGLEHTENDDTMFVYDGVYPEHLTINKQVSLIGANKETTIIDGVGAGIAVDVKTANVTIADFTIQNCDIGVSVNGSNDCRIRGNKFTKCLDSAIMARGNRHLILDNEITGCRLGIDCHIILWNNTIEGNKISDCEGDAVRLFIIFGENTTIKNNLMWGNGGFAINMSQGENRFNIIEGNTMIHNYGGIILAGWDPIQNILSYNNVIKNFYGIFLRDYNNVTHNSMTDNIYNFGAIGYTNVDTTNTINNKPIYYLKEKQDVVVPSDAGYIGIVGCKNITVRNAVLQSNYQGIYMLNSDKCSVINVTVSDNRYGFDMEYCGNTTLTVNKIMNNRYGVYLYRSSNNKLYGNNFGQNLQHAYSYDSTNKWDDGYPGGGNHWSEYIDVDFYRGPYQDESGSDGIWDHPYTIDAKNQDMYPLVGTPRLGTEISFIFQPNPVNPSDSATLSGTLKDVYGDPVFPAQVKVEFSLNGIEWNYIWTLNTNAAGTFYRSFTAPSVGDYLVRTSYAGSATYNPSTNTQTLTVQTGGKVNTQIAFTLSPNPASPGVTVTLSGTLKDTNLNPIYPAQVKIEYSTNGGATWNFFNNLNTNAAGQFSTVFNAPGVGTYQVRVNYAGSATYNPSSKTETLVVQTGGKVNTQIVFSFSPNPASPSQTVTLSGTLKDVSANPVFPASVTVEYSTNGGASWIPGWTLNTNSAGQFSVSFTAPGAGSYLARVNYAGSTTYNPSSSTQTLTVS